MEDTPFVKSLYGEAKGIDSWNDFELHETGGLAHKKSRVPAKVPGFSLKVRERAS